MRIYQEADCTGMSHRAANLISAEVIRNPACVLGLTTDAGAEHIRYDELVRSLGYADLQLHNDVVLVGDKAVLSKLVATGVPVCE